MGKNIRKHREINNLTQQELSSKLFVSFQAVSAWERGLALPDLENTAKLASLFNVPVDSLLYDGGAELFAAVDGGGTKTEFILFDKEGFVKKRLVLGASNPNDVGLDSSVDLLIRGLNELFSSTPAKYVFCGIAGATAGDNKAVIQKRLSDYYGIPVAVDTDAINTLCLGHDVGNTASVICGTGSCVFVRKDYRLTRIGGWGYLFDRAGSGYDIGNAAIRHALAVLDGIDKPTALSQLVNEKLGGDVWKKLSEIYEKGKPYIASFAPLVEQAASLGDTTSITILKNNAQRLAELITLARYKHGAPDTLVCSGGFFKNTAFKQMVEAAAGVNLFYSQMPAVYGAAVECLRLNGIKADDIIKNNFKESYR